MAMVYEREKRLLVLLDALGGTVGGLDFQKLLFLHCQEDSNAPDYAFIPYRFGAFSFTSYGDKRRLMAAGLLEDDDLSWRLTDTGRAIARQSGFLTLSLQGFCKRYANLRGDPLVEETYRRYPFYATRSEILSRLSLDPETLQKIATARAVSPKASLLTIGYEGRSVEAYLNDLLRAGVTLLCDVRRNPLSRKYGFAKKTLSTASNGVGIRYEHVPELGIASEERRELHTQSDYDALFASYRENHLPGQTEALNKIRDWIKEGNRVALTCYERAPEQCHRHCVAESLEQAWGKNLHAVHL